MFTLKIKWLRFENGEVVDETTLFIPANEIRVHAEMTSLDSMSKWKSGEFLNYSIEQENVKDSDNTILCSRLIEVIQDNKTMWYLASQAWLLGPDGSTIERVAP